MARLSCRIRCALTSTWKPTSTWWKPTSPPTPTANSPTTASCPSNPSLPPPCPPNNNGASRSSFPAYSSPASTWRARSKASKKSSNKPPTLTFKATPTPVSSPRTYRSCGSILVRLWRRWRGCILWWRMWGSCLGSTWLGSIYRPGRMGLGFLLNWWWPIWHISSLKNTESCKSIRAVKRVHGPCMKSSKNLISDKLDSQNSTNSPKPLKITSDSESSFSKPTPWISCFYKTKTAKMNNNMDSSRKSSNKWSLKTWPSQTKSSNSKE